MVIVGKILTQYKKAGANTPWTPHFFGQPHWSTDLVVCTIGFQKSSRTTVAQFWARGGETIHTHNIAVFMKSNSLNKPKNQLKTSRVKGKWIQIMQVVHDPTIEVAINIVSLFWQNPSAR